MGYCRLFPQGAGGDAVMLFEAFCKVVDIGDAAVLGDSLYLQSGIFQQIFSVDHALLGDEFSEGFVSLFFEKRRKIRRTDSQLLGHGIQTEIACQVIFNEQDSFSHQRRKGVAGMFLHQTAVGSRHFRQKLGAG